MSTLSAHQLLGRWWPVSVKHRLRHLLTAVATAVILWWLLRQSGLQAIWQLLRQVEVTWLLVGFGWYFFTNVCRAYRFAVLLAWGGVTKPLALLPDMIALSFLNNVLPARAGEWLFPWLLRRRHQVPVAAALTALLLAHLFDFLAVASLFLVFALGVRGQLTAVAQPVILAAILIIMLMLLLLASLPWLGRRGLTAFAWLSRRLAVAEHPAVQGGQRIGERVVATAELMYQGRSFFKLYAWSCVGWLGTFAWFYAFLGALSLWLPYSAVVVGATFATLSKAIPFATISGFGLHEAGWAFGFNLMGMAWETAVASGFAVNLLTLLASVVFSVSVFVPFWLKTRGTQGLD